VRKTLFCIRHDLSGAGPGLKSPGAGVSTFQRRVPKGRHNLYPARQCRAGPTVGNDPAKQFTAAIIDETDVGYYIIQSSKKNVRYIPRSLVSSIEFNKPISFF
jgi:hypothetical protein